MLDRGIVILGIGDLSVLYLQVVYLQINTVSAGDFAEAFFGVVEKLGGGDGLGLETGFAGFDASQGEQIFGEVGHAGGIVADDFQKLARRGVVLRSAGE